MGDISKDLDKYIAGRRVKREWKFLQKKKPVQEESVPEDLSVDSVHVLPKEEEGFWERLFKKKEPQPVSEDLSPEEMQRLDAMQDGIETIDELEKEHPEAYEQLEEGRETLLDKFFSLFRSYEHQHKLEKKEAHIEYVEEEVIPKIDEDVKEVLKITHKWLNKLGRKEKDNFKKSEDFQKYREILKKYKVAK